jgi:hypothetical protein
MNPRLLPVLLYLVAGAFLGYATLAAGPLAATLSVVMVIILLRRFRNSPERPGAYLLGFGLAGILILLRVLLTCSQPSCSSPSTLPGMAVFLLVALMGAWLVRQAIRNGYFTS